MNEISLPRHYEQPLQAELREAIERWYKEVAKLLPTLPTRIDIEFDDAYLVPGFGTGGAAFGPHEMKLAYNPAFDATHEDLIAELKASY